MEIKLSVTAGPHAGREFVFDRHDTFLVGRGADAHFQLPNDDPYFSRRHFLIEINPPRCRLLDLGSHNGTFVNGVRVQTVELSHGDEIRAGHTSFRLGVVETHDSGPPTCSFAGQPTAATIPPSAGEGVFDPTAMPALPGYRLDVEVGRGAMGIVYRGVRESDGGDVAIKIIRPEGGRARLVERFFREADILRQLVHHHIVRYHDSGSVGGLLFFVMDFVEGTDAACLLRSGGPMPIRQAARLGCQLLSALAYAHEQGFVHRDIKPANVLIEVRPGRQIVKLADFGLARTYASSRLSGLTMQGDVGGTLAFMPPEQITHFRGVRPAADQYAAAATLYNLLTGRHVHDLPYGASEQLLHILKSDAVPIRQRRADVSEELAAVLHRALAREPDDRHPSAEAFRQELAPFARG